MMIRLKKKRTKGGIARSLAHTNNKTQAPLSPELCNATTSNLVYPCLSPFLNLTGEKKQVLPYSYLQTSLDIPTIRQLEDLIIEAIYLDIIRGRLDQKEQQFEVEYTVGRDVPHEAIAGILTSLEQW